MPRHPIVSLLVLSLLLSGACASGGGLPRAAVAHNHAGAELLAHGRLDDAEARFRLALEYQPRFSEAHANLGLVAMRRGQLDDAERELRAAIRLNEDFALAYGNLGVVLEAKGDLQQAQDAYEHALSIDPGLVGPRRNLAVLLLRQDRFVEARAHLLRLVQLLPADGMANGALAYAELRLSRPDAALERVAPILERDPEDAVARFVRGVVRANQGDLVGAEADLEQARRDELVGRQARLRLAALASVRGDHERAGALLTRLLRERRDDPAAQLVAAAEALSTEDPAAARQHSERALHSQPELSEAQLLLARACVALHDAPCARHALAALDGAPARLRPAAEALRLRLADL